MNTFDAIAQIRREGLSRTDAVKFLVEKLGFNATYAAEIAAVIFAGIEETPPAKAVGDGVVR